VLVAQLNFQVVHGFAQAHEAEMPGLDHAGMNRADRHFMHLVPAHLEEGVLKHALLALAFKAHRLEPGVAVRKQARLFPQFAFQNLRRRVLGGEAAVVVAALCSGAQEGERPLRGLQHRGDHDDVRPQFGRWPAKQGEQALAGLQALAAKLHQVRQAGGGHIAQGEQGQGLCACHA
jgi:hypothetical protein